MKLMKLMKLLTLSFTVSQFQRFQRFQRFHEFHSFTVQRFHGQGTALCGTAQHFRLAQEALTWANEPYEKRSSRRLWHGEGE